MRLFAAAPIDAPEVVAAAEALVRDLRAVRGVRWVASRQLHFTLKFLGEVEESRVGAARDALRRGAEGTAPLALVLAGLGTFPPGRPARVVWVGCQAGGQALSTLAARVDEAFAAAGFPREERPFRPHLTLGRVKDEREGRRVARAVEEAAVRTLGSLTVPEIVLYQSVLSPDGPSHTPLARARLTAPT